MANEEDEAFRVTIRLTGTPLTREICRMLAIGIVHGFVRASVYSVTMGC